jgi:hypothetical protein
MFALCGIHRKKEHFFIYFWILFLKKHYKDIGKYNLKKKIRIKIKNVAINNQVLGVLRSGLPPSPTSAPTPTLASSTGATAT